MTFKSFDGSCSVADLSFYSKATDDNFFGDGKCHFPFFLNFRSVEDCFPQRYFVSVVLGLLSL